MKKRFNWLGMEKPVDPAIADLQAQIDTLAGRIGDLEVNPRKPPKRSKRAK